MGEERKGDYEAAQRGNEKETNVKERKNKELMTELNEAMETQKNERKIK